MDLDGELAQIDQQISELEQLFLVSGDETLVELITQLEVVRRNAQLNKLLTLGGEESIVKEVRNTSIPEESSTLALTNTCTEKTGFGDWEKYTNRIGSRLIKKMGYQEGRGLGIQESGRVNPVVVKQLPPGQGLGYNNITQPSSSAAAAMKSQNERKRKSEGKTKESLFSVINNCLNPEKKDTTEKTPLYYDRKLVSLTMELEKVKESMQRNQKNRPVLKILETRLNELEWLVKTTRMEAGELQKELNKKAARDKIGIF